MVITPLASAGAIRKFEMVITPLAIAGAIRKFEMVTGPLAVAGVCSCNHVNPYLNPNPNPKPKTFQKLPFSEIKKVTGLLAVAGAIRKFEMVTGPLAVAGVCSCNHANSNLYPHPNPNRKTLQKIPFSEIKMVITPLASAGAIRKFEMVTGLLAVAGAPH